MTELSGLKDAARRVSDGDLGDLVELSHAIHDHPETAFEESRACEWTAERLAGVDSP